MESRAKFLGHPIHQMLIVFPLGLLATGAIFDLIALVTGGAHWAGVAHYLIGAGLVGGLVAAVPGLVDWMAIPSGTRAKQIGLLHGVGNVIVLALFAASFFLRLDAPADPSAVALGAEFLGAGVSLATGWLGGELVDRLAVGVTPGAHLDAPSSLAASTIRYDGPDRRSPMRTPWTGLERRAATSH
jgi:uncharacterized membrane protein